MSFAPGTILVYDAGYSMQLPHFVRIESITPSGKSVRVQELKADFIPDDRYGQTGYKVPTDIPAGKLRTCRITKYGSIHIDNHYAYEWNGSPARYDSMD